MNYTSSAPVISASLQEDYHLISFSTFSSDYRTYLFYTIGKKVSYIQLPSVQSQQSDHEVSVTSFTEHARQNKGYRSANFTIYISVRETCSKAAFFKKKSSAWIIIITEMIQKTADVQYYRYIVISL